MHAPKSPKNANRLLPQGFLYVACVYRQHHIELQIFVTDIVVIFCPCLLKFQTNAMLKSIR